MATTCADYCKAFDRLGIDYRMRSGHIDINEPLRYDGKSLDTFVHYQAGLDYLAVDAELDSCIDDALWIRLDANEIKTKRVAKDVADGKSHAIYPLSEREYDAIRSLFSGFLQMDLGWKIGRAGLINALTIENFKGIADAVTIPLRPITLLFGRNSAGKSTILDALMYAHEVLDSGNWDPQTTTIGGGLVDLGGFDNLVHCHDSERCIRLRFDLNLEHESWAGDTGRQAFPIDDSKAGGEREIGDGVKSGWVELVIGRRPDCFEGLAHIDIGYDGRLLARLGRFAPASLELPYKPDAPYRAMINVGHPVFDGVLQCLPATETGMLTWFDCWSLSRSEEGDFYAPECYDEWVADEEGKWRVYRPLSEFDEDTMRGGHFCEFSSSLKLVEYGITPDIGRPVAYRTFNYDLPGDPLLVSLADFADNPIISSVNASGMPDLTAAITGTELGGLASLTADTSCGAPRSASERHLRFIGAGLTRLIYGPLVWLRDELASITYLGPMREMPKRGAMPPRRALASDWASGVAAWHELAEDAELRERCVRAMRQIGVDYDLRCDHVYTVPADDEFYSLLAKVCDKTSDVARREIREKLDERLNALGRKHVVLIDRQHDIAVAPGDVGTGVAQVLPFIVGTVDHSKRIFAVEQPELHLHPAAQSGLGDLLIEGINRLVEKPGEPGRLIIVETHSEHLLLRLLRRLREAKSGECIYPLSINDLSILYVQGRGWGAEFTRLELDENGEFLTDWPEGFFEERIDDLFGAL